MMDHVHVRAEDYDDIDERTLEVHEGHAVTVILSVPLESQEFVALSDIAERAGTTVIAAAQEAVREYALAHSRPAAS